MEGHWWPEGVPEAVVFNRSVRVPVILVIHAGGIDLCSLKVPELITTMRTDLERLPCFSSELVLMWYEIVSRPGLP